MPMFDTNDIPVEFACGKCHRKLKETAGRLKRDPDVTCPSCGSVTHVDIDDSQAKREFDKANRAIKDAFKGFK